METRGRKPDLQKRDRVVAMFHAGMTPIKIAELVGTHAESVRSLLVRAGAYQRTPIIRKARAPIVRETVERATLREANEKHVKLVLEAWDKIKREQAA